MARSRRMPVGSPEAGSRSMAPPSGFGVSRVMPASARARELAQPAWPHFRRRKVGWSAVMAPGVSVWGSAGRARRPGPSRAAGEPLAGRRLRWRALRRRARRGRLQGGHADQIDLV